MNMGSFLPDGIFNQARDRQELLSEIFVPLPKANTCMAYTKLRTRAAIDYPELGVAVLAELNDDQTIARTDICITALGARPIHVKRLDALYQGQTLDDSTIDALAQAALKRCKPLTNIASDPSYRREMIAVYVRRAFRLARDRRRLAVI